MIVRRVLAVALGAPLAALALVGPASAQTTYPPETLSTGVVHCGTDATVTVTVDGVMPNSNIHIVIDFDGVADVDVNVQADGLGFSNTVYPIPDGAGPVILVTITGQDFPSGAQFVKPFNLDRRTCPDLPETGAGNSLPIGKIALGATLVGAFLVVVALRRRPRHATVQA